MSKEEYTADLVNIFPDTQLLIFRFHDKGVTAEHLEQFRDIMQQALGKDSKVKVIISATDFDLEALDSKSLNHMGLFRRQDLEDWSIGELSAMALGVDSDEIPMRRIADALRLGDLEALDEIKQEMTSKCVSGECPICGTPSV